MAVLSHGMLRSFLPARLYRSMDGFVKRPG